MRIYGFTLINSALPREGATLPSTMTKEEEEKPINNGEPDWLDTPDEGYAPPPRHDTRCEDAPCCGCCPSAY